MTSDTMTIAGGVVNERRAPASPLPLSEGIPPLRGEALTMGNDIFLRCRVEDLR